MILNILGVLIILGILFGYADVIKHFFSKK